MKYKLNIENLEFNCLIFKRKSLKKNLSKPELYLWDLTSKAFVSSLFPVQGHEDTFQIDLKAYGLNLYAIVKLNHSKGTIKVLNSKSGLFVTSELQALRLDNNTQGVIEKHYATQGV